MQAGRLNSFTCRRANTHTPARLGSAHLLAIVSMHTNNYMQDYMALAYIESKYNNIQATPCALHLITRTQHCITLPLRHTVTYA